MNSLIFFSCFDFPPKFYAPEQPAPCFSCYFSSFHVNQTATDLKSLLGFLQIQQDLVLSFTIPPKRDRCFIFCFSQYHQHYVHLFCHIYTIEQIINYYKYNKKRRFILVKYDVKWFSMHHAYFHFGVDFCIYIDFSQLFLAQSVK